MSEALYRKYRSKSFKEVIGQEHITSTLLNSIQGGSFAHAYLLTGPHGVGKTSVARLFACEVNGIDFKKVSNYTDIIEIDAASNRRIDEIRELRERINIAPTSLKYKVYIIDEVHMLTKEAFNALLKTLEEPPAHVIFILATTDFHKVPDTIVSRCVRFSFQPIPLTDIEKHLRQISKKESIDIEDSALRILAENSEGSFRDAISLLDQFRNSKKNITGDYVSKILGLSPSESIEILVKSIKDSDPKAIINMLSSLRNSGASDGQITKQLINYLRNKLIESGGTDPDDDKIIQIIEDLLRLNDYNNTGLALEISLLKASMSYTAKDKNNTPKETPPDKSIEAPTEVPVASPLEEIEVRMMEGPDMDNDLWNSVLDSLKTTNNTLYGIARMAKVKYDGDVLELYFDFPFHLKQIKLEKNFLVVKKTVLELDKGVKDITLHIKEKKGDDYQPGLSNDINENPVSDISNIFGSAEVLES